MADKKAESLYDKILKEGKGALDKANGILKRRRDKRAFESAFDDLLAKKDAIEAKRQDFYASVGEYDSKLSKHLETAWEARDIDDSIELLKSEYKAIFGEEFNIKE
jgi:hypothetical protein